MPIEEVNDRPQVGVYMHIFFVTYPLALQCVIMTACDITTGLHMMSQCHDYIWYLAIEQKVMNSCKVTLVMKLAYNHVMQIFNHVVVTISMHHSSVMYIKAKSKA